MNVSPEQKRRNALIDLEVMGNLRRFGPGPRWALVEALAVSGLVTNDHEGERVVKVSLQRLVYRGQVRSVPGTGEWDLVY